MPASRISESTAIAGIQSLKPLKGKRRSLSNSEYRQLGNDAGRLDQLARIGLLRCREHRLHATLLHDLPILHDQHLMGHGANHVHIVGDEQIGQTTLLLQPLQQGQYLLLNGDVERTGGLVQHQDLGLHDERS